MRPGTVAAGCVALVVATAAHADVICRTRSGVLRMRPDTCKRRETALRSTGGRLLGGDRRRRCDAC